MPKPPPTRHPTTDPPGRAPTRDPQPTATAGRNHTPAWPIPSWQWACWVTLLLGGQTVLLVVTTWTLAVASSHGWVLPVLLTVGLLAKLVPDTLRLGEWAVAATTWTPPVDRHLHLAVAVAALVLAVLVAIAT